jgi:hypothetical protein
LVACAVPVTTRSDKINSRPAAFIAMQIASRLLSRGCFTSQRAKTSFETHCSAFCFLLLGAGEPQPVSQ